MAAGKKKTHTFQSLAGTRKYLQPFIALFYYTSSLPSLCSVKESSIQTQTNDSLGHWSTIFLVCWFSEWSQYSLPQQLISWFIGLSCSEQCDLGLSNTLGHHFIGPLACWVCMLSHVSCVWLFATLWTDYSLPGSSVHGILQAKILEWVAVPSSRESSQPWDQTHVSYISCTGRQVLYH